MSAETSGMGFLFTTLIRFRRRLFYVICFSARRESGYHAREEEPMKMLQRAAALALAISANLCFAQSGAAAFPDKPIRFVVGFTPGGPSDILARALGQKLGEAWAQQVVIENRPGAGGNIAAEAVARSAPDGHTWLLGNNSILATNQSLYAKLGYDPVKDF